MAMGGTPVFKLVRQLLDAQCPEPRAAPFLRLSWLRALRCEIWFAYQVKQILPVPALPDGLGERLQLLGRDELLPVRDLLRARNIQSLPPLDDRKSTRLNSSHRCISYAVFCLKKK